MALVDAQHQVIVHAEAFGESQEHAQLISMLEGVREPYRELGLSEDVLEGVKLAANVGYSWNASLRSSKSVDLQIPNAIKPDASK